MYYYLLNVVLFIHNILHYTTEWLKIQTLVIGSGVENSFRQKANPVEFVKT